MGGSDFDNTRRKVGSCGSLMIRHCPVLEESVGTPQDKMSSFSVDVDLWESHIGDSLACVCTLDSMDGMGNPAEFVFGQGREGT